MRLSWIFRWRSSSTSSMYLLGQGVLDLPEAIVVQLCGVDMAADEFAENALPSATLQATARLEWSESSTGT